MILSLKGDRVIHLTHHVIEKMSQRGIHKELIDLVLIYGHLKKDKLILNNKRLEKYLKKLDAQHRKVKRSGNQLHLQSLNKARSTLLKLRDKGGVTLVIMGETLITTYNTNMKIKRKRRYKSQKK